jgi:hypothetical protein
MTRIARLTLSVLAVTAFTAISAPAQQVVSMVYYQFMWSRH